MAYAREDQERRGLPSSAKETVNDVVKLVKLEGQLVVKGVTQRLAKKAAAAGVGAAGGLFALYGLLFLMAAGAAGLAVVLPVWAALLIVGGGAVLLGGLMGAIAAKGLRSGGVVPEETLEQVKEDIRWVQAKRP